VEKGLKKKGYVQAFVFREKQAFVKEENRTKKMKKKDKQKQTEEEDRKEKERKK
jgi:hypothetical protein